MAISTQTIISLFDDDNKYGIVLHSLVPVRAQASEESEQTTQLLFAETCDILKETEKWLYIRNHADEQEGWVDAKMLSPLTDSEYEQYKKNRFDTRVRMPLAFAVSIHNGQTFPLTAGTVLPNYENGKFTILGATFQIDPQMVCQALPMNEETFMQTVRFFLNIPYLWGGKNAMGMDCSGFTGIVMSLFGHALPRNASEQVLYGKEISFLQEAQCGDLAFFDHASTTGEASKISHVGILLDSERIVHCSGRVKIEKIDAHGIVSTETGAHTHELRTIRRLF